MQEGDKVKMANTKRMVWRNDIQSFIVELSPMRRRYFAVADYGTKAKAKTAALETFKQTTKKIKNPPVNKWQPAHAVRFRKVGNRTVVDVLR